MGFLDFIFGRKKTPIGQPAGVDGTISSNGYLVSFEEKQELRGRPLYTTYSNLIANTTIVGAAVRYFQGLVGGTSWTVEPKEGSGSDGEKAAKLVRDGLIECNMSMPWHTVVRKAAMYRFYGFSIHEWTMKKAGDGRIFFDDLGHRPQYTIERWDIPHEGQPWQGVVQRSMAGSYYYMPRSRLFYAVDNSLTDYPDGVGLLRHAVEHGRRLTRYEQLEGFGYESNLRGMPVGRIPYADLAKQAVGKPKGWFDAQVSAMETLVNNHIKTPFQGITVDSATYTTDTQNPTISPVPKWAIDIISARSDGLTEISDVIERINREIARVLGMEFLLLGGDGKGSLALSRDKTSMFAAILEATLSELAWFTVHDLVYPLLEMNGLDPEKVCPQVMPDPIATERIEVVVDALAKLAQAGAILMPDDPAIDQIRGRLHLADQPKLPPELLTGPRGMAPTGRPGKPGAPGSPKDPNAPDPAKGEVDVNVDDPTDAPTTKRGTFRRRMAG